MVGIGLLVGMGIYFYVWVHLLPRLGNYSMRTLTAVNEDGSVVHLLKRVPNDQIEQWDRTHDDAGNLLSEASDVQDIGNAHLVHRVKARGAEMSYTVEGKV